MLVDHADAGPDGVGGRADPLRLAVDADLAGIGFVEAVQDRHQGRFAGAVLADDAVDRAARDGKAHVAVGVDGAEALVDAAKLDRGITRPSSRTSARAATGICRRRGVHSPHHPIPSPQSGMTSAHRALPVRHVVVHLDLAVLDVGGRGLDRAAHLGRDSALLLSSSAQATPSSFRPRMRWPPQFWSRACAKAVWVATSTRFTIEVSTFPGGACSDSNRPRCRACRRRRPRAARRCRCRRRHGRRRRRRDRSGSSRARRP